MIRRLPLVMILSALFIIALSANIWAARIHVPGDFATIQEAVDAADVYDEIWVGEGEYTGAIINKPLSLKGADNATVITAGVPFSVGSGLTTAFRLDSGADGTEICHFKIANDASSLYFFAVFSRGVNEVSIHHLTITNTVQGISNYNGSLWNISHNKLSGVMAMGGGGIGILIGAFQGQSANDNVVSHNTTSGEISDETFTTPGICLTSLHGAHEIPGGDVRRNKIIKNTCEHTGVQGVGFESDDVTLATCPGGTDPDLCKRIYNNTIAFNKFHDSTYEVVWMGDVGENYNKVSRNLGQDRRADGLNPASLFK